MKGQKRIKLLKSQKLLLQMKQRDLMETMQRKQDDVQQTLNLIVIELGIPENEIDLWFLVEDGQAIERIKVAKPKKDKKPKGDKKPDRNNKNKKKEK